MLAQIKVAPSRTLNITKFGDGSLAVCPEVRITGAVNETANFGIAQVFVAGKLAGTYYVHEAIMSAVQDAMDKLEAGILAKQA